MTDTPHTPAHEELESLRVDIEYPEHTARATASTAEFDHNKTMLVKKRKTPCFKCGGADHLEVHHFIIEWSEWNNADPAKVLGLMHHFDIYGDAALLGDKPVASPDDLRNLMVLCASCHRGAGLGIHQVPVPFWFADLVKRDGAVVLKPVHAKDTRS